MPALSIAENIALGDPPVRRFGPLAMVDRVRMREQAREVLAHLDFDPDPRASVASLGFAERQLVAIAKALRRRSRVFILDEPTAALEKREIARLFSVLARMKRQGTAVIYISHRLDEVVTIADRCTVLRDGRVAAVAARGAFAVNDLVGAMIGRLAQEAVIAALPAGQPVVEALPDRAATVRVREREVVGGERSGDRLLRQPSDHGGDEVVHREGAAGGNRRQAPVAQHGAAVGDGHDLIETVGNVDDGGALPLHARQHRKQARDLAFFEGRGGFVEDEDAAARPQRLGDRHELTLGEAEGSDARPRVRIEVELRQHLARFLAHAGAIDHSEGTEAPHRKIAERDILSNRQRRHEPQVLGNGHDAGGDGVVGARKVAFLPVEADDAAVGTIDAAQNADQRRFARPVLPDDGVDFAKRHVEVDAVERNRRAEPFTDALSADGRTGHRESIRCHSGAPR